MLVGDFNVAKIEDKALSEVRSRWDVEQRAVDCSCYVGKRRRSDFTLIFGKIKLSILRFKIPRSTKIFIKDTQHLIIEKIDETAGYLMDICKLRRV